MRNQTPVGRVPSNNFGAVVNATEANVTQAVVGVTDHRNILWRMQQWELFFAKLQIAKEPAILSKQLMRLCDSSVVQ